MLRTISFALILCLAAGLPVFCEVVTNDSTPFNGGVYVACANNGAGEMAMLSGYLHILTTSTTDAAGGAHLTTHFQPMGISGVGMITGDRYQGTGVTRQSVNLTPGTSMTMVNNFRIIGQGRGNNYLVHSTVHLTINANGEVTADVSLSSTECR